MRDIVVGVDPALRSQRALRWALREGALHEATVHAVAAWRPPVPIAPFVDVDAEPYEREAKEQLERAVERALERTRGATDNIVPTLVRGHAPKVLVDAAPGADLLVVGTRRASPLDRVVLGSVSHHCVLHATVPIAVVPGGASLDMTGEVDVGIDGSRGSELALDWAFAEAAARRSRLTVVNGWWIDHPRSPTDFPLGRVDSALLRNASSHLLDESIFAARSRAPVQPPKIDPVPIAKSGAAALIERSHDADLVVVGSRGHSGLATFFIGSVSQRCLTGAKCVVVVVPTTRVKRAH